MLYGIATFRNKAHAEAAIGGMTDRFIGPRADQRRLKLRWDRTADALPDPNQGAKRARPWERPPEGLPADRKLTAGAGARSPGGSEGGWDGDKVVAAAAARGGRPSRFGDRGDAADAAGGRGAGLTSDAQERQDDCSVYVQNLLFKLQEDELGAFFAEKCGPVKRVNVKRDAEGRSRGFGFVEFTTQAARDLALATVNGSLMGGRELKVLKVEPRAGGPERPSSGGGGFERGLPSQRGWSEHGPPRDDFGDLRTSQAAGVQPPRVEPRHADNRSNGGGGGGDHSNRQAGAPRDDWRGNGGTAGPRYRDDGRPAQY
jgi:hypothetical protein